MLCGHATARVDEKGRFKIPSEFSGAFEELCGPDRQVYITSRDGVRVEVYPLAGWLEYQTKLDELPANDPLIRRLRLALNFNGRIGQIDPQGRLRIHASLIEEAGIDGTISVFGNRSTLEIMAHERVQALRPKLDDAELAAIADKYKV